MELDVGDYVVDERVVVERKTIVDLEASVLDARLFRQASALARARQAGVVILEGSRVARRPRLGRRQIQGALITLTLVFGIPLLRARSAEETVWLLRTLGRQSARIGRQ